MFHRRVILRRFVACGGIALALFACMQQSHALCGILGCQIPELSTGVELATADPCSERVVAKHGSCCKHETSSRQDTPIEDHESGIPCGPNCWCCQPAEPRQAPRDTTDSAKAQLTKLFVSSACPVCIERQPSKPDLESIGTAHFLANTPGQTCAWLCRFLT